MISRQTSTATFLHFSFFTALLSLLTMTVSAGATGSDTARAEVPQPLSSILVIPYMPMMHFSDADQDISEESGKEINDVRTALRSGLIRYLNQQFAEVYDIRLPQQDFVKEDQRDIDLIYHSLMYRKDTIYPVKYPVRDSVTFSKNLFKKKDPKLKAAEKTYINVSIRDEKLIPDLGKKYNADYYIFLNELDIKTHAEDCINLAMKIYTRELMVHYSIFDKEGKQVYGDLAVSMFPSNSNDVDEIMARNFPAISDHIRESINRVRK